MSTMELDIVKAPVPIKTETYTPISHASIITSIENYCSNNGLTILDRSYNTNTSNSQVTGKFTLSQNDGEMGSMIAFQNSYDKSLSVKFAMGASVFICSNGMVVGEHTFKRKHTGDSDTELIEFIGESVANSVDNFNDVITLKDNMKQVTVSENVLHELVGELFLGEQILRLEQLSFVRQQYNNPRFDYGVDRDNLWNIYNLFTDAIERKSHPSMYLTQHQKVTELINDKFFA